MLIGALQTNQHRKTEHHHRKSKTANHQWVASRPLPTYPGTRKVADQIITNQ
jgi:hypothetical protein